MPAMKKKADSGHYSSQQLAIADLLAKGRNHCEIQIFA